MTKWLTYYIAGTSLLLGNSSFGTDNVAIRDFLAGAGTPPQFDLKSCVPLCRATSPGCQDDITSKAYRCFRNCSHHIKNPQMMKCANSQFQEYLKDKALKLQRLTQQNRQHLNNLANLQNRLNQANHTTNNLRAANQQHALNIRSQQDHIRNLLRRLENLSREAAALKDQLAIAQREIAQRDADLDTLNNRLAANQEEISRLTQDLNEAEERIRALEGQVDNLQDQLRVLQNQNLTHQTNIQNLQNGINELQRKKQNLKARNQGQQAQMDALNQRLVGLTTQLGIVIKRNTHLQEELKKRDASIDQLQKEIKGNEEEIARLTRELQEVKHLYDDLLTVIENVMTDVEKIGMTFETRAREIRSLQGTLKEHLIASNNLMKRYREDIKRHFKNKKEELKEIVKEMEEKNRLNQEYLDLALNILDDMKNNVDLTLEKAKELK